MDKMKSAVLLESRHANDLRPHKTLAARAELRNQGARMPRIVKCVKLGRELPGLDEPPFDTPLGQRIYESISAEAWRQWSEHSKMLLNEYRLQPWKPEAQQFLVEQMELFLFGSVA